MGHHGIGSQQPAASAKPTSIYVNKWWRWLDLYHSTNQHSTSLLSSSLAPPGSRLCLLVCLLFSKTPPLSTFTYISNHPQSRAAYSTPFTSRSHGHRLYRPPSALSHHFHPRHPGLDHRLCRPMRRRSEIWRVGPTPGSISLMSIGTVDRTPVVKYLWYSIWIQLACIIHLL